MLTYIHYIGHCACVLGWTQIKFGAQYGWVLNNRYHDQFDFNENVMKQREALKLSVIPPQRKKVRIPHGLDSAFSSS